MPRKTLLKAATVATLAFGGLAAAQTTDVRREDRQADRRADANEVEVKLALPRNADGTINTTARLNDVRAQFAAGTTETQFRGATAEDAKLLLEQRLFADLKGLLPNDGVERSVRLRGEFDARLQRNEEGELRARVEGITLGTLSPAQRAELALQLASQSGLDRILIRGTDDTGARVRVEFRADKGIVKNEGRADAGAARGDTRGNARNDNARNGKRVERPERAARAERVERPERAERPDRIERPERSGSNSGRG